MVVVALVERGGMGGKVAAPIAGRIFREIFHSVTQAPEHPA